MDLDHTLPRIPTDPLEALGDSVFLTVLASLPYYTLATTIPRVRKSWAGHYRSHQATIWRQACDELGIDTRSIIDEHAAKEDPDKGEIDWLGIAKGPGGILLDQNWWIGRCKERLIGRVEAGHPVWKFRMNEEEGTCLTTNRSMDAGLLVGDTYKVSRPIFDIPGLRSFGHIEYCKGYAVFDCSPVIGTTHNLTFQVYRTQSAISNSENPYTSVSELPVEAARSSLRNWQPQMALQPVYGGLPSVDGRPVPLPRGGLAFYREIEPPSLPPFPAMPFRVRMDGEGIDKERPVLVMASEEGIYSWDLEDETKGPEVFEMPDDEYELSIRYVDFDEDYIFVAGQMQMHVFRRKTKRRILAFPPLPCRTAREVCSLVYTLDLDSDVVNPLPTEPKTRAMYLAEPTRVGRAVVPGVSSEDPMVKPTLPIGGWPDELSADPVRYYEFSACHTTGKDLVCTSKIGQIFIVRDYATILAMTDSAEMFKRWAQQTTIINLDFHIRHLAVNTTGQIVITTTKHVVFFDMATIPSLPLPAGHVPPIRIHSILDVDPVSIGNTSCVQISKDKIHVAYRVIPEGEVLDGNGQAVVYAPDQPYMPLMGGGSNGYCVKEWDFAP